MTDSFPDPLPQRRYAALFGSRAFGTAALLCVLRLFCACSLYQPTVSLTVQLPPVPQHWLEAFPQLEYRLIHPAPESGSFEERRVHGRTPVLIRLPKLIYLPVLAYPIPDYTHLPGQSIELPPAGGVYPLDCDVTTETISLSWQEGTSAEILCRLWSRGVDCSAVNVPRLIREMREHCQGDPWSLDSDRICARLAAETFRLTDIRPAPCRDLRLEPGTGSWFLESPFCSPVFAQANGSLFLEAVPLGAHFLFEYPAGGLFFLYVEEETTLIIRQ